MKGGIRSGVLLSRIRRYAVIVMAAGAVYTGMRITPAIMELHGQGVRRNVGADGETLQQLHAQAELIGKGLVVLALVVIALHIATLRSTPFEEPYDDAPPLPPGPMGKAKR
jgi:hypothetical protein